MHKADRCERAGGGYYVRAAVIEYLRPGAGTERGTQQVGPVDLLVSRDHAAAAVDLSGRRRRLVRRDRAVQLLAFRDGQIVMRRVDQGAFGRF